MKIQSIGKIRGGQDGAIYGSELFRFDHKGECRVFDLKELSDSKTCELAPIGEFLLDRAEDLPPHSNAVCFGCDFFEAGDEYPLLYSNVYNNFSGREDELIGICFVYRIRRIDGRFTSTMVQAIEIGFCEDASLWKATEEAHGVRPYGNFLVDRETRSYYAFVMRNKEKGTRYFKFDLPSVHEGAYNARLGVKTVVLGVKDIKEFFDCSYHHFVQGAILHGKKIYSTEGFGDTENPPAFRIIDLESHKEEYINIMEFGYVEEPEFIDVYNGNLLYSDACGNLYRLEW